MGSVVSWVVSWVVLCVGLSWVKWSRVGLFYFFTLVKNECIYAYIYIYWSAPRAHIPRGWAVKPFRRGSVCRQHLSHTTTVPDPMLGKV